MKRRSPRPWTDADREQLRLLFQNFGLYATARLMRRSVRSVCAEAMAMGIEPKRRPKGETISHLFRKRGEP